MNFGYFCNTTNWDKKPYTQLLDEAREITEYCDQNNWNSIWYTEHHFNHEGMESCTNPLMMCTDAAARTKNIRLGQACNVITFHNPIRLAEDIATLDQMSKGRVEVGIGRGVYGREAINMNKEADLKDQAKNFRLFSETLEIMKKAWSEDFFSHQGEFYTYPSPNFIWQHDMSPPKENVVDLKTNELKQISVLPKPYQKPFPPISQVVDGERSIQWAAENGLNTIMWIPTVKALKKRFEIYKDAKSKAENRDVPLGEGISLVRDMFVAETMEEAGLTSAAFAEYISFSGPFLAIAVVLFALSTMISWSYYGLQSWMYVFGKGKISDLTYKILFLVFIVIGAAGDMSSVWAFSDAMILALVFPNMIGLFILFPKVKEELAKYVAAINGKN